MTTRMPTEGRQHPLVEKRAYEFHDPFPDQSAAPNTFNRPRGYIVPRSAPRQAVEGRLLQGMQPEMGPPAGTFPSSSKTYPGTVRQ